MLTLWLYIYSPREIYGYNYGTDKLHGLNTKKINKYCNNTKTIITRRH